MRENSYSKFERLSTRRLESMLRRSVKGRNWSPEDLLAISEILERRDAGKGIGPPDAEAAWEKFLEKTMGGSAGSPPAESLRHNVLRKRILQRCAILAVCIFSTASVILATQAFGYDIVGIIVHRTADVFHFETVGLPDSKSEGLQNQDSFPSTGDMPAEFTPSWLPKGFEKTAEKQFSDAGFTLISVEYVNKEKVLTFSLTRYDLPRNLEHQMFEKQMLDVERYTCNGKEYILSRNGRSEFWIAVWSDGPLVFQIQGDVTRDDLATIIEFLGGTKT